MKRCLSIVALILLTILTCSVFAVAEEYGVYNVSIKECDIEEYAPGWRYSYSTDTAADLSCIPKDRYYAFGFNYSYPEDTSNWTLIKMNVTCNDELKGSFTIIKELSGKHGIVLTPSAMEPLLYAGTYHVSVSGAVEELETVDTTVNLEADLTFKGTRPSGLLENEQGVSSGTWLVSNKRLSTRSGPGTNYSEPGSFKQGGEYYQVFSRYFDGDIWWAQVELTYLGKTVRVYTGLKRFNVSAEDLQDVPVEKELYSGKMNCQTKVLAGPGSKYSGLHFGSLDDKPKFSIKSGKNVIVFAVENGYAQIDFSYNNCQYRGWVPVEFITRDN